MIHVRTALLSVYYKDGLDVLAGCLREQNVHLISTGGTRDFLEKQGCSVERVEDLTRFPEMLGGRVKTLHPRIFGGILHRRHIESDLADAAGHNLPAIDLVVVNLYPFSETRRAGGSAEDLIEKIDIGGVSLIRAAAKNFRDVCVVCDPADYASIAAELQESGGWISLETLQRMARKAFQATAAYDAAIQEWMEAEFGDTAPPDTWVQASAPRLTLRYGENPHQKGFFYGSFGEGFRQIQGKELSYNNIADASAACQLLDEFSTTRPAAVVVKHTNACGVARAGTLADAWKKALACDPVSAFGGVIALNQPVDTETAASLNELFFEVLLAPAFDAAALTLLSGKKNRILICRQPGSRSRWQVKSAFDGLLVQEPDSALAGKEHSHVVTLRNPTPVEWESMLFASVVVKHTKSNTIVLARGETLLASGTGQTSRVDALRQAIWKAREFGFDLTGAAMASDAFFPFPDCVEIAAEAGISAVIQPGGSIRDTDSVNACNRLGLAMVTTGLRHFKH